MHDAFPKPNEEPWSQFDESEKEPEIIETQNIGRITLGTAHPVDNEPTESDSAESQSIETNVAKTNSAERLEEKALEFDTAENLAERREKLKKGIKIVVGGPPHSGKSVFIQALMENLDRNQTFLFSAAPDGEGPWLQRHYDDPEVVKLRQKGSFTPEFVSGCQRRIKDWDGPLMIIDVGGRTSEENAKIIEGATHAIILAGDLSEVAEWRNFFGAHRIDVIAKLHSHYRGNEDFQRPMGTDSSQIVGSVHHLERGESAVDRETIKQVAGLIHDMVEGNVAYQKAHNQENINPYEVIVSDFLEDLPSQIVGPQLPMHGPENAAAKNKKTLPSAIPKIYEKALSFGNQPVWLNGPANPWEAIAMALAFKEAGSSEVRLRSPDGYIAMKDLPESEELDEKWWEAPEQQGEFEGKPVYIVHHTAHIANNPVNPKDLETMTVPKLPENAIVIISTQGPNWLKASIAAGYHGKVADIATFQPGEDSIIAWSKDKQDLGKGLPQDALTR